MIVLSSFILGFSAFFATYGLRSLEKGEGMNKQTGCEVLPNFRRTTHFELFFNHRVHGESTFAVRR